MGYKGPRRVYMSTAHTARQVYACVAQAVHSQVCLCARPWGQFSCGEARLECWVHCSVCVCARACVIWGWDGGLLEASRGGSWAWGALMVLGLEGIVMTPPAQCFLLLFGQESQMRAC